MCILFCASAEWCLHDNFFFFCIALLPTCSIQYRCLFFLLFSKKKRRRRREMRKKIYILNASALPFYRRHTVICSVCHFTKQNMYRHWNKKMITQIVSFGCRAKKKKFFLFSKIQSSSGNGTTAWNYIKSFWNYKSDPNCIQ